MANAERIVACVNACEGINPEAVPELLDALQDIIADHDERVALYPESETQPRRLEVMGIASAAIARATGKEVA